MKSLTLKYEDSKRFTIESRGHKVTIDLPIKGEGTDKGMMPTELFVGSIAGCMGVYIVPFCQRHNIELKGTEIKVEYTTAKDPHRIDNISVNINIPEAKALDENLKKALLRVTDDCTVHNTLKNVPKIDVKLSS